MRVFILWQSILPGLLKYPMRKLNLITCVAIVINTADQQNAEVFPMLGYRS
jgi:hypothetical protein